MKTIQGTQLNVSPICLGADIFGWKLNEEQSFAILDRFSACGGNFIDTANVYARWLPQGLNSSEIILGKWIKRNREKHPIIATKGCHYNLSNKKSRLNKICLQADLDSSLHTLNTEVIDLYYLHRDDPTMEIGEIIELLEEQVRAGKILYYGASNFTAERLYQANMYAQKHNLTGFSAISNQYSYAKNNFTSSDLDDPTLVLTTEKELKFHRETQTPLIPYQSTARGFFSKRVHSERLDEFFIKTYQNPENDKKFEKLLIKSRQTGFSVQTLSLVALVRSEPFQIIPITSVNNLQQLKDIEDALLIINRE